MSLMTAVRRMISRRSSPATPEANLIAWANGGSTGYADISVNESTALTFSAVWACVRILSETIGSLPCILYQRTPDGGKKRVTDHYLADLIRRSPNPEQTPAEYFEFLVQSVALWGNAYIQTVRDNGGRVRELWPLRPNGMTVSREKGVLVYTYRTQSGQTVRLSRREVHHVKGLTLNGVQGVSVIEMHRNAISLGLATEKFGGKFFGNATHLGGFLQHPTHLSPEAADRLRQQANKNAGLENAHRIHILEEGMKFQPIGIPPEDAQFLQTRKFQLQEIARIYRIPLHMLADLDRATFSNIEQQSIEFVVHTIRPWVVRLEQAMNRDFISDAERRSGLFLEFLVDGLLRGDIASRYSAYATGRQNGWLSANDIRRLENMNPIEDGDIYLVPLNMVPASSVGLREKPEPDQIERRALPDNKGLERRRLRNVYKPVFRDAMRRIIKRQTAEIGRAAKKMLTRRDAAEFTDWLEEYYDDLAPDIQDRLRALFRSYAEAITEATGRELGEDIEFDESLETFVADYLDSYTNRHIDSRLGQLKALIEETPPENSLDAITERLDEWDERGSDKETDRQTVQLGEAVARTAMAAVGITRFQWVASGANPCPFCLELDGVVVGQEEYFAEASTDIETGAGVMKVYGNKLNPPLHEGCECQVVAG